MTPTRRDFLRQLGLLSAAAVVGPDFVLPLARPSLLTAAQKAHVVECIQARSPGTMNDGLPEGVRFVMRVESWGMARGMALRVRRGDYRVKHGVGWSDGDSFDTMIPEAVDCLVEWYDREGCQWLGRPESYIGDPDKLKPKDRKRYWEIQRQLEEGLRRMEVVDD